MFYDLLALIAGSLLPLAFAPFHFYPMAILSPAVSMYAYVDPGNAKAIHA